LLNRRKRSLKKGERKIAGGEEAAWSTNSRRVLEGRLGERGKKSGKENRENQIIAKKHLSDRNGAGIRGKGSLPPC